MSSQELSGWIEYLRIDERIRADWATLAIIKAFNGDRKQQASAIDDDEEVIDTTAPGFADKFKGFTNTPGTQRGAFR